MTAGELFAIVNKIVAENRGEAVKLCKALVVAVPENLHDQLWGYLDALLSGVVDDPDAISIVLVHGIRTDANWFSIFTETFSHNTNVRISHSGYGFFTAVGLWGPLRRSAIAKVERELREDAFLNPASKRVIVAHSFGTYIISKILESNIDIRPSKLILCGSIVKRDFHWTKHAPSCSGAIVNDVGTRDLYPILASASTLGYGGSGLMGFQTGAVKDRFFDYGHSDFFSREHIEKYWKPFILSDWVEKSEWDVKRPKTPYLAMLLEKGPMLTLGFILLVVLLGSGLLAGIKAVASLL